MRKSPESEILAKMFANVGEKCSGRMFSQVVLQSPGKWPKKFHEKSSIAVGRLRYPKNRMAGQLRNWFRHGGLEWRLWKWGGFPRPSGGRCDVLRDCLWSVGQNFDVHCAMWKHCFFCDCNGGGTPNLKLKWLKQMKILPKASFEASFCA